MFKDANLALLWQVNTQTYPQLLWITRRTLVGSPSILCFDCQNFKTFRDRHCGFLAHERWHGYTARPIFLEPGVAPHTVMKAGIHPEYKDITVTCSCGNAFTTRSTGNNLQLEVCSNCHPFYTGKQKTVDTGGRVDKFRKRYTRGWSVSAATET